jgi:hypothetical protein
MDSAIANQLARLPARCPTKPFQAPAMLHGGLCTNGASVRRIGVSAPLSGYFCALMVSSRGY